MRMDQIQQALDAYLSCALWSCANEDGDFLDVYQISDFSADARAEAESEIIDFITANLDDLAEMEPEQVGHDFWLTRNGHGAGFWDRGLGAIGDRLTEAAKPYGPAHCFEQVSERSGLMEIIIESC